MGYVKKAEKTEKNKKNFKYFLVAVDRYFKGFQAFYKDQKIKNKKYLQIILD